MEKKKNIKNGQDTKILRPAQAFMVLKDENGEEKDVNMKMIVGSKGNKKSK